MKISLLTATKKTYMLLQGFFRQCFRLLQVYFTYIPYSDFKADLSNMSNSLLGYLVDVLGAAKRCPNRNPWTKLIESIKTKNLNFICWRLKHKWNIFDPQIHIYVIKTKYQIFNAFIWGIKVFTYIKSNVLLSKGVSINYVDKQGRGSQCQRYYISLFNI